MLWILNTGAQRGMLPQCYPNYKPVHRRFQQGCRNEVLRSISTDLADALREQGLLNERESFIDATFVLLMERRGDGQDPAGRRHQNHGDSRSSRIAAGCQYLGV